MPDEEEEPNITVFAPRNAQQLITCNASNLFEVWEAAQAPRAPLRAWKAHASPISVMTHHPELPLLATGSADHSIRVWDSEKSYCTHNFKGVHSSIVSVVSFHSNPRILQLFSGSEDGSIAVWDLHESKPVRSLKGAHVNAVTALSISPEGKWLLSAGRDQVVNIWSLAGNSQSSKPLKTIAVMEAIEAAGFLGESQFFTAGEKGMIRIWDLESGRCLLSSQKITSGVHAISQLLTLDGDELMAVSSDLSIYFVARSDLALVRTFIGHHGEFTDSALFADRLALGTNSPDVHLYSRTEGRIGMNCTLLKGHSEAVICLDANEEYLISGSRDHNAILWQDKGNHIVQAALLSGHTDVVSAVALSRKKLELAATVSSDMTLKLWKLSPGATAKARLGWTVKAHDKDINFVTFTPNDKHIITASQDKTIKIWKTDDGTLITTLAGHKRGVWSVAVSPTEQLVASASADRTVRLWSLVEQGRCLKTLEGHSNSVLRVQFSKDGSRIITAGSDGLVKVWDVRKGDCLCTLDAHSDRIWTFLLDEDDSLITGDASGILKVWRDVTEEQALQTRARRDELILKEQELSNLMVRKDYTNALLLAMQLEQPQRSFHLFGQVVEGRPISEAVTFIAEMLGTFDREKLYKLVAWIRDWNTSLKRSYVAQLVLHALLKHRLISAAEPSLREMLASHIKPYSEKHFEKIDELIVGSHLIDLVVDKIK